MMDVKRRQRSVRARAIFDDDRLAEYQAELVRNDAGNRVAPAARTKHVNDCERPGRIIVGIKRRTEQCGPRSHENENELFHARSLLVVASYVRGRASISRARAPSIRANRGGGRMEASGPHPHT